MRELAAGQHGVVALRQLVALGIAAEVARSWVVRGRLIRLYRGVFAVGHAQLRTEGHYMAAVLACGPGAALSYRSAGGLLNVRGSAAASVDVTAPIRTGRRKAGIRVHRGDRLRADEIVVERQIPCTTVARTLLDLAVVLDRRGIEAAVETAERLQLLDLRDLTTLLARHRGRRGTAKLRQVLTAFDHEVVRARSELEARFFHLCVERQLPRPLVNRMLVTAAGSLEVDFHWPAERLVVETDGRAYHGTTTARARDPHRDRLLTNAGWTVKRCDWQDVVITPEPLIACLRRHLNTPR